MDFAGFMDLAGQLQDSFCGRRLARINVGKDTDISVGAKVFHFYASALLVVSWHRLLSIAIPSGALIAF
jgi:hypothetical protein